MFDKSHYLNDVENGAHIRATLCTMLEENQKMADTFLNCIGKSGSNLPAAFQWIFNKWTVGDLIQVLNACGLENLTYILGVYKPLEMISESPSVCICSGLSPVELSFKTKGVPRPSYRWYRKYDKGQTQFLMETGSVLAFHQVKTSDSGIYYCESIQRDPDPKCNRILTTLRSHDMLVNVPPTPPRIVKQPQPVKVLEGECLTLQCEVVADPHPRTQWRKNGKVLDGRNETHLKLYSAKLTDSGEYSCEAENTAGCAVSDSTKVEVVQKQPLQLVEDLRFCLDTFGEIDFIVNAKGHGPLTYTWFLNGSDITTSESGQGNVLKARNLDLNSSWRVLCHIATKDEKIVTSEISHWVDPLAPTATAKIAIIISNGDYRHHNDLMVRKDVLDVTLALEKLAFVVIPVTNLKYQETMKMIKFISGTIPKGSYVVVYTAGHGFMMDTNTYLMPVDAGKIPSEGDSEHVLTLDQCICIERMISDLSKNPKCLIVIVDVCRQSCKWLREEDRKVDPLKVECDTLMVYSTLPECSAAENKGIGSIYIKYLLSHIHVQKPFLQVLQETHNDFYNQKKDTQSDLYANKPTLQTLEWHNYSLHDVIPREDANTGREFLQQCVFPMATNQPVAIPFDVPALKHLGVRLEACKPFGECNALEVKVESTHAIYIVIDEPKKTYHFTKLQNLQGKGICIPLMLKDSTNEAHFEVHWNYYLNMF